MNTTDFFEVKLIPVKFLDAIDPYNRTAYFDLHLEYMQRFDCNQKQAWQYLEEDLQRLRLPHRYQTYSSFRAIKSKYDHLKRLTELT